jgi:predicted O-methyltransferase YrrM
MDNELWQQVDSYLESALGGGDRALQEVLQVSAEAGLPAIQVSAMQGKFLQLLARLIGAERVLEIGSLGGYSAIWMARALPAQGRLISLEVEPRHAEVARSNIARAGLSKLAEVRLGAAILSGPCA